MFKRFMITFLLFLSLASLSACGVKQSTPAATSSTPENDASANVPNITTTEASSEDNYQMLPQISENVANVSLDTKANGTTQQLKMGDVMAVSLESNPSTGYAWRATITDPSVLVQMGDAQYQQPATPLPGSPETQVFYFQAAGTGSTTLTLDYMRSFETNVAPEKIVVITVEVR